MSCYTTSICTDLCISLLLRDRARPDHQSGGDPRQGQRTVRLPQWDDGVQGRPQQQPRGQEPSRAHRDRPGSGPPPPPHRDRQPRDRDQVGTEDDPSLVALFPAVSSPIIPPCLTQTLLLFRSRWFTGINQVTTGQSPATCRGMAALSPPETRGLSLGPTSVPQTCQ